MRKIIVSFLSLLFAGVSAHAQGEVFGWMCQEKDPARMAVAGTNAASCEDISFSAFHNAAAIPFSGNRFGVGISYSRAGKDMMPSGFSAGAGLRLGKRIGLAVAGNYNLGAEYEIIDEYGNRSDKFKTSSMLYSLGLGVKIIDMLSIGVNLKYAMEKLGPESNNEAFGSDIFLMFKLKGLWVAAGVCNIGTKVKDASGMSFSLPSSARAGISYSHVFGKHHLLDANLDADFYFSGKTSAAGGLEYGFHEMIFVRGGYRFSSQAAPVPSYASVGLGVKFWGVHIDASYLFASKTLNNSFSLSLGYCF